MNQTLDYTQRGQTLRYSVATESHTITLPALDNSSQHLAYVIAADDDGLYSVTITPNGTTINGQSTLVLRRGQWARVWAEVGSTKVWRALLADGIGAGGTVFAPEEYGNDVQAAIDAAYNGGGGTVLLTSTYTITTPLQMRTNVMLEGRGHNSGLTVSGNIDAVRWEPGGAYPYIWNCGLRNMAISLNTSTAHHMHFVAGEPWAVLVEDVLCTGGSGSAIRVETGVNPFESTFQRIRVTGKATSSANLIHWAGGGSGITMDRLYFEPDGASECCGLYFYSGNFVVGLVICGRGVIRALHNEYARTSVELIHYEPNVAFSNKADSIVFQQFQNGFLRVGGVQISSGVTGNAIPNHIYKLGFEAPICQLGPFFSHSSGVPTIAPVYYSHGSQNNTQFYWGPADHIDKSIGGTVQCVSLGGLSGSLRVGSSAGDVTLDYPAEIYGNLAQIVNDDNILRAVWAYAFTQIATAYIAFTESIYGNSSTGVRREMVAWYADVLDPTNTSEDADWVLKTILAGTVGERVRVGASINALVDYYRAGTKVVGTRRTGWTAATGTADRGAFDTATVTTEQLARRVKALLDDLIAHGLIGT